MSSLTCTGSESDSLGPSVALASVVAAAVATAAGEGVYSVRCTSSKTTRKVASRQSSTANLKLGLSEHERVRMWTGLSVEGPEASGGHAIFALNLYAPFYPVPRLVDHVI